MSPYLHFYELHQLRIVDQVDFVHEHGDVRNAHLMGEQNVLAGLRHRAVHSRNHQNGSVHLRSTRDHVLHIIGVAGAIDVGVVTVLRFVLHMRRVDGDSTSTLFGSFIDLIVCRKLGQILLGKNLRDSSGQSRLSVIDVSNRSDIAVRLLSLVRNTADRCKSGEDTATDNYGTKES